MDLTFFKQAERKAHESLALVLPRRRLECMTERQQR
jgi:hypothetical protein